MSTFPEVEVIMPIFNGEKYLLKQVESIFLQTLKPYKLIVLDDGSSDQSVKILQSIKHLYNDWLRLELNVENKGINFSINKLAQLTTSPLIALSDQDDIWHPLKLEKLVKIYCKYSMDLGEQIPLIVHSNLQLIRPDDSDMGVDFYSHQKINPYFSEFSEIMLMNNVTGCTILFNQPLLKKAFPFPPEVIIHDWWLALIASLTGLIIYTPEKLVFYRQHPNNLIGSRGYIVNYFKRVLSIIFFRSDRYRISSAILQAKKACEITSCNEPPILKIAADNNKMIRVLKLISLLFKQQLPANLGALKILFIVFSL